jgi:hypothetical protein
MEVQMLREFIMNDYMVEWYSSRNIRFLHTNVVIPCCRIVDNLPSAIPYSSQEDLNLRRYESGFPLGAYKEEVSII